MKFHAESVVKRYEHTLPAGQKVLISGASGFVGAQLTQFLTDAGHAVSKLVRRAPLNPSEVFWNPEAGEIDTPSLEGFDFVIHLAGESIASRWTKEKKRRILESRVQSSELLCETISHLKAKPRAFITASAIGYYGDRGSEICTEETPPGEGFLAEVCKRWEGPSLKMIASGVRAIQLRFGIVLSPKGGALSKMILPFRLGLGGPLGNGQHFMSWIALCDLISAIYHCMATESIIGPVNGVAPNPVTNRTFTKSLGAALHRPTIFPVPALLLQLLFGEMADEALLASTRAVPARLLQSEFQFFCPNLEEYLVTEFSRAG